MRRKLISLLSVSLFFIGGCGSMMDEAVSEYLQENPDVIKKQVEAVLKEKGIQGRPKPKSIDEMMKTRVKVGLNNAATKGPEDAEITIIEFSDFQCPFCNRVVPTMNQLLKDYKGKIRIAFRQHPLGFHKRAMPAAKASLAAGEQGKFWEMHDILFENQKDLSDANIMKMARDIGLNQKQFKKDWQSDKYDKQIAKDMQDARSLGAKGTPAFFVNGIYVKGAKPLPYFKQLIGKLLAQDKKKDS